MTEYNIVMIEDDFGFLPSLAWISEIASSGTTTGYELLYLYWYDIYKSILIQMFA